MMRVSMIDRRIEHIAGAPLLVTNKSTRIDQVGDFTLCMALIDKPNPEEATTWFYLFEVADLGFGYRRRADPRLQRSSTGVDPFEYGVESAFVLQRYTSTNRTHLGQNTRGTEDWAHPWGAALYDRHLTDREMYMVIDWLSMRYNLPTRPR